MTIGSFPLSTRSGHPVATGEIPEQRRILAVLVLAQIMSGAGLTAGITVGALLAEEVLGSTGLAGVPSALFTAGAALGALCIGRLCARWGRRPGLALGYATGALGSAGVVVAAATESVALLFPALVVYGMGTATGLMARYAGADLASPARRGRAVSAVLFATTLGAVTGPMLVTPAGEVAHAWGVPRLAGPFLPAAAAFAATAVVLACRAPRRRRRHRHDGPGPGRDDRDHDDDAGAHAGARSYRAGGWARDLPARRSDVPALPAHRAARRPDRQTMGRPRVRTAAAGSRGAGRPVGAAGGTGRSPRRAPRTAGTTGPGGRGRRQMPYEG